MTVWFDFWRERVRGIARTLSLPLDTPLICHPMFVFLKNMKFVLTMKTEEEREKRKISVCHWSLRPFGMLITFPFTTKNLNSSLGFEPACRMDKSKQYLLPLFNP
jgi:hypothetical protein